MGLTAENLARKYDISREAQEAFALESQQRTVRAAGDGNFDAEIVAIENGGGPVTTDGCPRPDSSLEALAGLKPAFDAEGSITAGTSSPLTDGAAAVLVTSADYARRHKLTVMAHIRATAVSGCAPAESSAANGSSSSSVVGWCRVARASASRCNIPRE